MDFNYWVQPMQQRSAMTCLPTAFWMLHRWYLDKIGAHNATPIYEAIVNVSQKQFDLQEQQAKKFGGTLAAGVTEQDLTKIVRENRFNSDSVDISPELFETQLRHGPFVYIERLSTGQLPVAQLMQSISKGSQFDHAVLVIGIRTRHSITTLFFNDPGSGRSLSMEFFAFVMAHRPLGTDKAHVIFIS